MQQTTPRFLALLAAGVLVLATFASFPALRGRAVYDDAYLPTGLFVDELADVGRTFWLTSYDYRLPVDRGGDDTFGVTYRPVTEATFVLTSRIATSMTAHHVTSLLLHALTAFLVGLALVRAGKPNWVAALAAGVVASHPALVEAWVWVAGRADLIAGLCIAIVAAAIPSNLAKATRTGFAVGAIALVAGTLAKETFVFLGPVVAIRGALVPGVAPRTRATAFALLLLPLAALALMSARIHAQTEVIPDSADLVAWLRRTPRVLGDAAITLSVPYPRVMRTLAYETLTPVSTVTMLGCAAFGLGLAASLSEKKFALALVFVGIAATLCVSTHVADHFWLGFDRFLYAPLVALTIVGLESFDSFPEIGTSPARFILPAFVVALAAMAHLGSRPYASARGFEAALIAERPTDPTGHFLQSRRFARERNTERALESARRGSNSTSPALERERATRKIVANDAFGAESTIAALRRVRPDDAFAAADQMSFAIARQQYVALPVLAETAAKRVAARRTACVSLLRRRQIEPPRESPDHPHFAEAMRVLRCSDFDRR